jgi:hypothetical protein
MNNLEPRKGRRMSRSQRVDRGANLVMATGAVTIVFGVTLILWIFGVIGGIFSFISLVVAVILGFLAYRTIKT